jgi:hypothetical protein
VLKRLDPLINYLYHTANILTAHTVQILVKLLACEELNMAQVNVNFSSQPLLHETRKWMDTQEVRELLRSKRVLGDLDEKLRTLERFNFLDF